MKRKEFKNMFLSWNKLLNEGVYSGEDRIKEMISTLYFHNKSVDDKIKVRVDFRNENAGRTISVSYLNMTSNYYSSNNIVFECLDVYEDQLSMTSCGKKIWHIQNVSQVNDSWGPLLYEVGIEVISLMRGGIVVPGRERVSNSARSVWLQYLDRAGKERSLNAIQIDFDRNSKEYSTGEWERNFEPSSGLTMGYYKEKDTILVALKELNLLEII
tara:strand:- start:1252 stop:1893 length:642 start_codon:yes stop_codon:yes gene_type:complete